MTGAGFAGRPKAAPFDHRYPLSETAPPSRGARVQGYTRWRALSPRRDLPVGARLEADPPQQDEPAFHRPQAAGELLGEEADHQAQAPGLRQVPDPDPAGRRRVQHRPARPRVQAAAVDALAAPTPETA